MSESKSLEQLQAEYSNLCAQAGHIGFNIYLASKDLAAVQDRLLHSRYGHRNEKAAGNG